MKTMTDVFQERTAEVQEENLGLYTTIRRVTLDTGSKWLLAANGVHASATPIVDGIKRDDERISGRNFAELHTGIVLREGLLP